MWFSFDYGNVHFVSINTETDYSGSPEQDGLVIKELYNCGHFGDQMKWLKADLAKADANRAVVPWIIVVGHRPFYSTLKPESDDILWGGVSASMSAAFEPLFKASSVDLYVGGHVHAYERHLPVSRGSVPTPAQPLNPYFHPAATVHVTPGSAGNVEGLDTKEHWYPINRTRFPWFGKRDFQSFGYGILRVRNATNLHWSFVNAKDDSILDEFELVKADSTLVARHVPWHEASFWLDECVANVPTLIAVGSLDTIMSPRAASQGFGSWKARRKGVRVLTMEGMGHGGWLTSELAAESLVASIAALRIESASIAAADEFELTW